MEVGLQQKINVLSIDVKSKLQSILETVGCKMQDIDHEENNYCVLEKVFTRANLSFNSNIIEKPYYSTSHEPLCIYCGSEDDL